MDMNDKRYQFSECICEDHKIYGVLQKRPRGQLCNINSSHKKCSLFYEHEMKAYMI